METTTSSSTDLLPAAVAAAKWWADKLRGPVVHDAGDDTVNLIGIMASISAPKSGEVEADIFEHNLSCLVDERLSNYGAVILDVDYQPCAMLCEAAQSSGARIGDNLPWKTCMWVRANEVKVSCGYRAPMEVIYSAPIDTPAQEATNDPS